MLIVNIIMLIVNIIIAAILALTFSVILWYAIITNGLKRESIRATRMKVVNTILETWGDKEHRRARRYIFRSFRNYEVTPIIDLPDDICLKVEMVLTSCDRISYLAVKDPAFREDVLELIGRPMIHVWDCTESFIEARREETEERLDKLNDGDDNYRYMVHFERFVDRYRTMLHVKLDSCKRSDSEE